MGSLNSIRCHFSFACSSASNTRHTHTHQPTNQPANSAYRRSLHTSFGVKSNVSFLGPNSLPLAYHLTRFTHFIAWFCGNGTFDFESTFFRLLLSDDSFYGLFVAFSRGIRWREKHHHVAIPQKLCIHKSARHTIFAAKTISPNHLSFGAQTIQSILF